MALTDGSNSGKVMVMEYSSGAWVTLGSSCSSLGDEVAIAPSGTLPFVVFEDLGSLNFGDTALQFTASSAVTIGNVGFTSSYGRYPAIYVYNGTPYVVFRDETNSWKTSVMTYAGGVWTYLGTPGLSAPQSQDNQENAIYVDNGTPYVAFGDDPNGGKAIVVKYTGSAWTTVGSPDFTTGNAGGLSLAVDNGTPYVAYQDGGNGFKATVMKFNGTTWVTVGNAGFSPDMAFFYSNDLVVYNGTPYVAFGDEAHGGNASVMVFN